MDAGEMRLENKNIVAVKKFSHKTITRAFKV